MTATCTLFATAMAAAKMDTIVFPEPTSPCKSLFMEKDRAMSSLISLMTFFWALVNSKFKLSEMSFI